MDNTDEITKLAKEFETWEDVEEAYGSGDITSSQLLALLEVFNLL